MNRPFHHVTLVEPGTVKLERLLPGPIERVWAYLTESEKRGKWFASGEFELRVGGKARFQFDHASLSSDKTPPEKYKDMRKPAFEGVITRCEPPRLLAHTWNMGNGSEVSYELEPRGKNVLLTIVHRRLDTRERTIGIMSGWDTHTGILEDILNGLEPRPFWKTHGRLEEEYAAAV